MTDRLLLQPTLCLLFSVVCCVFEYTRTFCPYILFFVVNESQISMNTSINTGYVNILNISHEGVTSYK